MNQYTKKAIFASLAIASLGAIGSVTYPSLQGDMTSSTEDTNASLPPIDIMSATLTPEQIATGNTLDVSTLKTKSDTIKDLPEHLALEQNEIYSVVRTDLALRIKNTTAKGNLTFDTVYTQNFLTSDKKLDTEKMIDYIVSNISFIGSGKSCEITPEYKAEDINNQNNEKRINKKTKEIINFKITIICPENITNARVKNTLFTNERMKAGHFVSLYSRHRTNTTDLASGLITNEIPTLEWNTPSAFSKTDSDGDGFLDAEEAIYKTNPMMYDTDADGDSDYKEIERGTNPLKPASL